MAVLKKIEAGSLARHEWAKLLGRSYRQLLRLSTRYAAEGTAGIGHLPRNRHSNRKFSADCRDRILKFDESKFHDFWPHLASENLAREDGEMLSEETLRLWLTEAGLWQPRRRGARHRPWRERRASRRGGGNGADGRLGTTNVPRPRVDVEGVAGKPPPLPEQPLTHPAPPPEARYPPPGDIAAFRAADHIAATQLQSVIAKLSPRL